MSRCRCLLSFIVAAISVSAVSCYPVSWVQKIVENQGLDVTTLDQDNSLATDDEFAELDQFFKTNRTKNENYTSSIIPFTVDFSDKNETAKEIDSETTTMDGTSSITTMPMTTTEMPPIVAQTTNIDPVASREITKLRKAKDMRNSRQKVEMKASQEADSSEEEEGGGNMITGLLSAFLSGLSRPDGSVDLEAIVGLLGSLSTQNPDGTYDFNGLTELLRSFFGGGGDGGGGSDIGAFVGGLTGAILKGIANPPGPKGVGILAGKVVTGVLPALSPEPAGGENGKKPPAKGAAPQLDSGSFLTGFLKTALGSGGNGTGQGGKTPFINLIKLALSAVTGVISAGSSLSSKSDWN